MNNKLELCYSRLSILWILWIAGCLAFGADSAFAAPPADVHPRARGQIAALLREKQSWTLPQIKMESRLIHAAKRHRGEPFATGLTNLSTGVAIRADGRVLVDIKATVTPALLQLIQRGGGQVI